MQDLKLHNNNLSKCDSLLNSRGDSLVNEVSSLAETALDKWKNNGLDNLLFESKIKE